MVNEEFLQFIWRKGIFIKKNLRTTCGKSLIVIHQGVQNFDAGPDFLNARIRVDQMEWAGNVEIHLRSSDWIKHRHHTDPGYNNVILHVVRDFNGETMNSMGRRILTVVLDLPWSLIDRYPYSGETENCPACCEYIHHFPVIQFHTWLTQLQSERMVMKSNRIQGILRYYNYDWEETLYLAMASGFGIPLNCLPFELTAARIPLQMILQNRDNPTMIEALLFGVAGFLQPALKPGTYRDELLRLYNSRRDSLTSGPLSKHLWKFLRLRPVSFPTLRISQFASLVQNSFPLMDKIIAASTIPELEQLLKARASKYWNTHYVFEKCSPESVKQTGGQTIRTLIINVVVPFLNAYGKITHHKPSVDRAAEILIELDAESNQITRNWLKFGIRTNNAFESQALIHLHNRYCKQNRCLDCQIGASFFKSPEHERQ